MLTRLKKLFRSGDCDKAPRDNFRKSGFIGASFGRTIDWVTSFGNINADLKMDYVTLTSRSRSLAKNNTFVIGFLNNLERNVLGPSGFRLQPMAIKADGTSYQELNSFIFSSWQAYSRESKNNVSQCRKMGARSFDNLVLRTLFIDGEVFIRKHIDPTSPYGYRYEVIDSLRVDPFYNTSIDSDGMQIKMGIKLDPDGVPVSYYIFDDRYDFYHSGEREQVPADQIIHIFNKHFPDQVRGISSFSGALIDLHHESSYTEAELVMARMQACNMVFFEKNPNASYDDFLSENEVNNHGEVISNYSPGQIGFAPSGYTAKQFQTNHPNNNFAGFIKAIFRRIANSLGISYNKATGDYESVNYSSLREATLEDRSSFETLQVFLISNWKELQYDNFLIEILSRNSNFHDLWNYSLYSAHKFIGRTFEWVDPLKEITAIGKELELRLTSPIEVLERKGRDPATVIEEWRVWNKMLEEKGVAPDKSSDPELFNQILQGAMHEN